MTSDQDFVTGYIIMGLKCCVPGCYSGYDGKHKTPRLVGFHAFPKDKFREEL